MANEHARPVKRYTDLTVWQAAMDFTDAIYSASDTFLKHEAFGLTSQIRRASVSTPSNIGEGAAADTSSSSVTRAARSMRSRPSFASRNDATMSMRRPFERSWTQPFRSAKCSQA